MRRLDVLKSATTLQALNVPGFNFHQLTGRAKSEPIRYSIHVNGPWTLTYDLWHAEQRRKQLKVAKLARA